MLAKTVVTLAWVLKNTLKFPVLNFHETPVSVWTNIILRYVLNLLFLYPPISNTQRQMSKLAQETRLNFKIVV